MILADKGRPLPFGSGRFVFGGYSFYSTYSLWGTNTDLCSL